MRRNTVAIAGAALAASALVLAGCSSSGGSASDQSGSAGQSGASTLPVVAVSSYPLQYIAEQVGGEDVEILNLASSSGHAHDMELSPSQVNQLSKASVALYLSEGFQPAVETAIEQSGVESLDGFSVLEESQIISGDPHLWLDPTNVALIGDALAADLSELAPEYASAYQENAERLTEEMNQVDAEYSEALADCSGQTLLTTHEAFGYLAARYGLEQVGVLGVDPEAEPSPARLREISTLIQDQGITVLFVEPAGSEHTHSEDEDGDDHADEDDHDHDHAAEGDHDHAAARTVSSASEKIASSLGVPALILDPMEVQVDTEMAMPAIFEANLASLQEGMPCAAK